MGPLAVNFDGIAANGTVIPPDPNAAVGSTQVVELVNSQYAVYSKAGTTILPPTNTNTLWSGFGGACETTDDGDAVVRWDTMAGRWIITQFANLASNTGPYLECLAVSTSADATGAYNRYSFSYANLNDYPKLSVWPDAYYITYNMFSPPNFTFAGPETCALDRASMLIGAPASQQCFTQPPVVGGLLASDLDGSTPPPSGEPALVVSLGTTNTTLDYWKFHVDWTTPANSTFTGPVALPVNAYAPACGGGVCIPQGGTIQQLDSLADRLMYRLAYRNFGGGVESLVVNHAVTAGTSSGERWYELRLVGGNPVVFQQGTYAPDSTFRWMGSIAEDKAGDIALGYSQSSSTSNPSIRYTGRRPSDPLGTMTLAETTVFAGSGSQIDNGTCDGFCGRWGDYTSMAIDPTDDCTFWYTNQYIPTNGNFNWHTRLTAFKFTNCGAAVNDFSISVNPPAASVVAGASVNTTVSTAVTSGSAQNVALTASGLPAGATAAFNPLSVTAGGSSTLTVSTSASTPAGSYPITITGTGTSAVHTTTFKLTVNPALHHTRLTAKPAIIQVFPLPPVLEYPFLKATLTDLDTGQPVPGQTITFTTGNTTLCTATTDNQGTAVCNELLTAGLIVLNGGYNVTFAGTASLQPASAHGGIVAFRAHTRNQPPHTTDRRIVTRPTA